MNKGRTLVLGGGGIAGLGWLAGLMYGLVEHGADLRSADRVIGTSAGSATATQLRTAQSIETLYARQTDPALIADEPQPAREMLMALMSALPAVMELADPDERMQEMGAVALAAKTVAPEVRREMIKLRLSEHDWPEAPLSITAIDVASGALVTFDRASGMSLIDAVAASCAVPGIWPVVTNSGRAYMDGGVHSADNAHLAEGSARVVVASPTGESGSFPPGYRLGDQVSLLERNGSTVLTMCPDDASRAAMGVNPFDPAIRTPSAEAGRAQGHDMAASVAAFWN